MSIVFDKQYEREFLIRHRMPRPISRSYEAVAFAPTREEDEHRIVWCASVTIRFLGAVKQANYLALNRGLPINPPSFADIKLDVGESPFIPGIEPSVAAPFAQLAGIYSDRPLGIDTQALRRAFSRLLFLARYLLIVSERDGFRVLWGPRIERPVWAPAGSHDTDIYPPGTAFLLDPESLRFLTLSPFVIWKRDERSPFGKLFVLRRIDGGRGHYIEEGIPGSSGHIGDLEGYPRTGVFEGDPSLVGALTAPPGRFADGSFLGDRYGVLGITWKGGISDIYIARRCTDNGLVMLKTLETERAGFDENYWHFINEERNARGVNHLQVIKPEKRVMEGYGAFYEQEMVQRGSLNDLIEYNGVLSVSMAIDITVQLLDVLAAVHASGIAHNDIKPDNILFDGKGKIRLIDFGIAFSFAETKDGLRPGVPAGSEGYMAPELKRGSFPSVQSDLYSAGIVLVQMLSGEVPASLAALHDLRAVPRKLFAFLEKCLSDDPANRFASAAEALAALRGIHIRPEIAITLDVEGTLITNYADRSPRPGLYDFLSFCMSTFDRIFVYTMLDEERTREVFLDLVRRKAIPSLFVDVYEYVQWVRGADGSIKDLRRCRVPLEHNAIVDDMRVMIPEDQKHRWIQVPDYNYAASFDGGLLIARGEILKKYRLG